MTEDALTMEDLLGQTKTRLAQTVRAQARLLELLHGEKALAEQRLAVLENAITWDTTCLGCSKHMDTVYELDLRNAQIRRVREILSREDDGPFSSREVLDDIEAVVASA